MKIAAVLNVHGQVDVVKDTLDSIRAHMTDDILVVVDGAVWHELSKVQFGTPAISGFYHNHSKSPYRNVMFGLMEGVKRWPKADWYCYLEYDCLVANDNFKTDLKEAGDRGYWCLGVDHRIQSIKFPFLEQVLNTKFDKANYLLGCCVFHKGDFLRGLHQANFFERLLYFTNAFSKGFFPQYEEQGGYDFAEHLFPTLAAHFGGGVGGLSTWDATANRWIAGRADRYPIRWRPELEVGEVVVDSASILHPLKEYNHPLRVHYRHRRN